MNYRNKFSPFLFRKVSFLNSFESKVKNKASPSNEQRRKSFLLLLSMPSSEQRMSRFRGVGEVWWPRDSEVSATDCRPEDKRFKSTKKISSGNDRLWPLVYERLWSSQIFTGKSLIEFKNSTIHLHGFTSPCFETGNLKDRVREKFYKKQRS